MFSTILTVINSQYKIKNSSFGKFCLSTAELYVKLYGWYNMPVSVHKVLIHGPDILNNFIVPIGTLSEEAQEAKNKYLKYYREHHTRKISTLQLNDDLFKRLLLSSALFFIENYFNKVKKVA